MSCVHLALDLTTIDNFDQVLNQTLDSITDEQDQAVFIFLVAFLMQKELYQGSIININIILIDFHLVLYGDEEGE